MTMFAISATIDVLQGIGTMTTARKQKKLNKMKTNIDKMNVKTNSLKAITNQMKEFDSFSKEQEKLSGSKNVAMAVAGLDKRSSVFQGVKAEEREEYFGNAQTLKDNIRDIELQSLKQQNLLDHAMKIENGRLQGISNGAMINSALSSFNAYNEASTDKKIMDMNKPKFGGGING